VRGDLWRRTAVTEGLQPGSVFARQPGGGVDCLRCLLEFLFKFVQINQRAADFFPPESYILQRASAA